MDERYMKIAIVGFVIGVVIFLWLGVKVLGSYEVVDPDKTRIEKLKIEPQSLLEVIKLKQERHIKKSYSDKDCYTKQDYDELRDSDKLERLTENLKNNAHFLKIIVEIQKMPQENWEKLRNQALEVYSPTWETRQKVGPPGQTQAGQDGEKLVGKTIVNLVSQMKAS